MARLFGTDGVRGVAGRELTASLAMELGAAAMVLAAETHKKPLVVIGRDTRASGDLLAAACAPWVPMCCFWGWFPPRRLPIWCSVTTPTRG